MEIIISILGIMLVISLFAITNAYQSEKEINIELTKYKNKLEKLTEAYDKTAAELFSLKPDLLKLETINNSQNSAIEELANFYINDSLKFICSNINANNFEQSRKKAEKVFNSLRKLNINFPSEDEKPFYRKVRDVYDAEVRKENVRREQVLIKERIRDEQKAAKEKEDTIKQLERDAEELSKALEKAKKQMKDEHSIEVEALRMQLAEALAKAERVKSQAELTKSGFIYVVSNIGSFGERIFKVGMTRRLEPMDRIKELSDASVPFPFDVHLMVSSEDAPSLESNLHKELHKFRVNRVNMHKEFFNIDIHQIVDIVRRYQGKVEYKAKPEALEYFESQAIAEKTEFENYDTSLEKDNEDRVA